MKVKKLMMFVLALVLVVALAACGGGKSDFVVGGKFAYDGERLGGFGKQELQDWLDNPSGSAGVKTGGEQAAVTVDHVIPTEVDGELVAGSKITVGSTTEMSGEFLSGWGNNAMDSNVRDLLYGLGTVTLVEDSQYEVNPLVVESHTVESADNWDKTHTFKLREDLVYFEPGKAGEDKTTPITAKDYVFAILHGSSADLVNSSKNSKATAGFDLVGYKVFNDGAGEKDAKTSVNIPFKGVRLLGEYEFSLTIDGKNLPYFYELTMAAVGPTPMHIFAPEADVEDTEEGAKITGTYSAAVLKETVVNDETRKGFKYEPTAFTGPYQLVSYDNTKKEAVLKANPHYKGQFNYKPIVDANGMLTGVDRAKPVVYKTNIDTINVVKTANSTEMSQLENKEVNLLPQINGGDSIKEGLALANKGIKHHTFARAGYGHIAFHSNAGPTQYVEVRQAIAYLLDRTEFASTYTGGFGELVHGPYGAAMWMYQDTKDNLNKQINPYTMNLDTARETLIAGGWVLDSKGNAYTGKGLRHKLMKDGKTLMPLEIEWLSTPDNPVSELIAAMLPENAEKVGMKINQSVQEFAVLLDHYYGDVEEKQYHMFNLATNFTPVYDQFFAYHPAYEGYYNTAFLVDKELFMSMKELREFNFDQTEEYAEAFVKSVVKWNELLPGLPLYSDLYHAFYSENLTNLRSSSLWGWQAAIVNAKIASE